MEARVAPIVILAAGPGWGKTTLLAQWAVESRRPFAWVDVDESDNDPIVLLTYVAAALDRITPLGPSVFEALSSPGVSVEATVLPRLGAALASMDRSHVLVLDDLHMLDNRACLDAIATLARHVPEGSQMALSTRSGPVLPLGALRARGLSAEIGSDDLRLDAADAQRLLSAAGVELPEERVAELTEHTEGWAAGLYLAALSSRAQGANAGAAAPISGSDRLVSEYLRSELLAHLSADEFHFLTRTAPLERMSGPLCDAVLETSGSAAILGSLARSNLFLVPLDAVGDWYRYHHLFRELLSSELAHAEPDLAPRLLERAAEWCEADGQPEAAMAYAQQAGDVDRAARLFAQWGPAVYQTGRAATAERWVAWLEARGALERNALVAMLGALLATLWGRPAEAERRAEAAERAGYQGPLPDGSPSVDSWLAHLRALRCQRGPAKMREDAEFALRTLAPRSVFRPNALLFLAVSQWLVGDVDDADDLLADAAEESLELGAIEGAIVALGERAVVAIGCGRWTQAEGFVERARHTIARSRMAAYPSSALVYAAAARVALHRGETPGAHELLARAPRLRLQLTYALPWIAAQTRLELARAYLTIADTGGAETMLREVDAMLRRQPDLGRIPAEMEELRSILKTMRATAPGASTLTEAELRVLPYLATHLSFREIGERLYLSRHTVKSHAMSVYRKLSVTCRNDAVERAAEFGLL